MRRWRTARLCAVLSLALPALAFADSSTAASKSAPASPSASHGSKTHSSTSTRHTGSRSATHKTSTRKTAPHESSANKASARTTGNSRSKKGLRKSAKKRGQQVIDSTRAREIQEALIREHYLEGEPSGTWDSATQAAMQHYQEDQGWQSKTIPDSRALIKLGLGPSNDHLLNPESAMTAADPAPQAQAPQANQKTAGQNQPSPDPPNR